MKHLLAALLLALTGAAHAATYYVSDCGTGANASCVAGIDTDAGTSTSTPWKTCAKVVSVFASLAA
ncbi:MAG: hypothetical protein V4750_18540, partial [Pseudomonadota bacterium]